MVSCQCPSVVWLGNRQQVNYTERSLFTLPRACLCGFYLIDFLLPHFVALDIHCILFEVSESNQSGCGLGWCLVSALSLFGWETDSKSIILGDLCSHFLAPVCVFSHSLTLTSFCPVLLLGTCIALWDWHLVQCFKLWLFSFSYSYCDCRGNVHQNRGSVWREAFFNSRDGNENCFRLISCSRREREFLSLNLVLRDKNENFFLLISCFETRTRISFINLRHRDENENRDWDNSRENSRELHLLLV